MSRYLSVPNELVKTLGLEKLLLSFFSACSFDPTVLLLRSSSRKKQQQQQQAPQSVSSVHSELIDKMPLTSSGTVDAPSSAGKQSLGPLAETLAAPHQDGRVAMRAIACPPPSRRQRDYLRQLPERVRERMGGRNQYLRCPLAKKLRECRGDDEVAELQSEEPFITVRLSILELIVMS